MKNTNSKKPNFIYWVLLAVGFLGLGILGHPGLTWESGLAGSIWILAFLVLTGEYRSKLMLALEWVVLCAGYLVRFLSAVDITWLYFLLFPLMSILIYGVFLLYGTLIRKWNRFYVTLAFPAIWTVLYLLAAALRFPSLVRVDMLFINMPALIQAESLIGSVSLSFLILWILAILHFSIRNRKSRYAGVAAGVYALLLLVGVFCLYSNVEYQSTVRVAYTTGPYVGDYLSFSTLPAETCLENVKTAAREAAEGDARILVFSEEYFCILAIEEDSVLEQCCAIARENRLHMLIGLDVNNRAASSGAKSYNKIVWISDEGEILGSYRKTKLIPVLEDGYQPGDGEIPSHTITIDGNKLTVSYLICYDSNFPAYVSRMDPNTDILFLPSWDWRAVTELHAKLCCTLAVQNRVSILKCTYDGISITVNPDGEIIQTTDTAEVGFGSVQFTDIPAAGDQTALIGQADKAGYIYAIIAAEALSILIGIVLLYGSLFENGRSPRNRCYAWMVVTCMAGMAADMVSWILEGHMRLTTVLYGSTFLSMALTFVIACEFIAYLTAIARERRRVGSTLLRVYSIVVVVITLFILITSINGKLFSYENGCYQEGPWYDIYVVANVGAALMTLLIFIRYAKVLNTHDIAAAGLYILIPSVVAIINVFNSEVTYAYPASMLSLVVLYVMIQSEQLGKLRRDGQYTSHMATHDVLTGLQNRYAYDERLNKLASSDVMAGVIFADVNGLKHANDTYGHAAGDKLITDFADKLISCFRKDDVFRISGDEFVVIMAGVSKPFFEQRAAQLSGSLLKNDGLIACIGSEYGSANKVKELLKIAESYMYEQKEAYHAAHPELNRR